MSVSSIMSFLALHAHVLFVLFYGAYSFYVANKSKPWTWLVPHILLVAAGAALSYFRADIFFISGGAISLGMLAKAYFFDHMPIKSLSDVVAYLKKAFNNAVVYPATVFDEVYNWVESKAKSA